MAGDPTFLRRLVHRIDFPDLYPHTEDRVEQLAEFTKELVRCTQELPTVRGIGRVEGMRQVFEVVDEPHRHLVRGTVRIMELDFTSEATSAILQLLENGFMYNVKQKAFVAEGML